MIAWIILVGLALMVIGFSMIAPSKYFPYPDFHSGIYSGIMVIFASVLFYYDILVSLIFILVAFGCFYAGKYAKRVLGGGA